MPSHERFVMKVVYALFFLLVFISCSEHTDKTLVSKIAHAGGGFNGEIYTDSLDALNLNKNSYTLFDEENRVRGQFLTKKVLQ